MAEKSTKPRWFVLDNAALLYSAIQRDNYSAVYRFSAVMVQPVDPVALQRAIDLTMPRFPTFHVRIKRGAFWYYFEPNDSPGPFLKQDMANPCQPMRFKEDGGHLVRFFYYDRRISVECFHALSDGGGAMTFFRTVLAVYLRQLGVEVPDGEGVLDITQPPRPEELEDAYQRYATVRAAREPISPKAFHASGTPEPFYTLNYTMGLLPLDQVRETAHRYSASVTEYLAAVLIHVLLELQKRERPHRPRQVALAVPINLRGWFPTETLRNFILTVRPYIDPKLGDYSFPEIVSQVHHYMRLHINRAELHAKLTGNVNFQRNRLLQLIPVFLKDPIMAFSYRVAGVRPYSTTFTNPGAFRVPEAMAPHIERMELILGQPYGNSANCAAISYGNTLEFTIAGCIKERDVEREFFRFLVRAGIHVKVISNRED